MKRQVKEVENVTLESTKTQPIAFDANVEELLNHLGDLIGEVLITEIIKPNTEVKKEVNK